MRGEIQRFLPGAEPGAARRSGWDAALRAAMP
jgi:hypothetical protein